jgi:CheY-like chemotaxis protein
MVFMDMQMPVMGGVEATRIIQPPETQGHTTPIIAMTVNAMDHMSQSPTKPIR